jgi:hypothetical protein
MDGFVPVNNFKRREVAEGLSAAGTAGASMIGKLLQCRTKAQAAVSDQRGAEHLGAVVGKPTGKPAADFLAAE